MQSNCSITSNVMKIKQLMKDASAKEKEEVKSNIIKLMEEVKEKEIEKEIAQESHNG
jgi:hypothetical protein